MSSPPSAALSAADSYQHGLFGPVEVRPLSNIRGIVAKRVQASWGNVPHVSHTDDVDATALEAALAALQDRTAVKLTLLPFVVRACALALMEFPEVNASLCDSGRNLILKKYCHIGFTTNTPAGLLAPVIRDVDKMTVLDIAAAIGGLTVKARAGRLTVKDMKGACFTISDLGEMGDAPEVATLGIARVARKPVAIGGVLVSRPVLPLRLVYDTRAIDGALGGEFMAAIRRRLANPDFLLS